MRSFRFLTAISLVAGAAVACNDLVADPQQVSLEAASAPGMNAKGKKGTGSIAGSVTLAPGVVIPACPVGTNRSIRDFVPTATASTLVDDEGAPIVRTGSVRKKGPFSMKSVELDSYTLGFLSPVELGSMQLVFEADVLPGSVDVEASAPVTAVEYTITSAMCQGVPTAVDTIWVATDGSGGGDGSSSNPYNSISVALTVAQDGNLILVRPGLYEGGQFLSGSFEQGVIVRSEIPYAAQLRNNTNRVVGGYVDLSDPSDEISGITLEGFDMAHSGPGTLLVVHLDGNGTGAVNNITFRNNVIHDSYDNDILKLNAGVFDVLIEGNMFYNQAGFDEHIDVNGTQGVIIQDNIFFNDFEGSGRAADKTTGSFIVIKDSNAGSDINQGALDTVVRRNVFLNYQGHQGFNFVLAGEDGHPFHEAINVLVENNLMIGNNGSSQTMRAPMGVKGAKDVTFRNNTVTGDLPSLAYGMRVRTEGSNPPNENINFYNNIWSDPTGTMGASPDWGADNDFSDSPLTQTFSWELASNLYWNGGAPIPSDPAELINYTDDLTGIVGDPQLMDPANVVLPRWNPGAGLFADGSSTIREVFVNLVNQYGTPASGSVAIGAGDPSNAPVDDILGNPRGGAGVDIGAVQR